MQTQVHDHNSKTSSLFLIENPLNLYTWATHWNMHFCSCSVFIFMGYEARLSVFSCQTCANSAMKPVFAVFLKIIKGNYSWRALCIISLSSFGDLSKVVRVSCPFPFPSNQLDLEHLNLEEISFHHQQRCSSGGQLVQRYWLHHKVRLCYPSQPVWDL